MVVPAVYGWVLVLCAGCAEPSPPATLPAFPGIPTSAIESAATLVLGLGGDGPGHYFERITNVGMVGDSLIVVVDSGALRVGVYGLDGAFRRWLTGKGEGPGEVRNIGESGIRQDGSVWVLDRINRRLSVLDVGGELLQEVRIPGAAGNLGARTSVVGPTAGEGWWIRMDDGPPQGPVGEFFRVPVTFAVLDPDGTITPRWRGVGEERLWMDPGRYARRSRIGPLSPRLHSTTLRGDLLLAWSDSAFVLTMEDTGGVERFSAFTPRRRVHEAYRATVPGISDAARAMIERYELQPEIKRLLPSPEGMLWAVQVTDSLGHVDLLGLDGDGPAARLVGRDLGHVTYAGPRWVLTWDQNDLGEPFVSLHAVRPPDS